MGLKIDPAEVKRWEAAGLIATPPKPPAALVAHHRGDGDAPGWRVVLLLPGVKLVSRSNERSHWAARHKRDKAEAAAVDVAWAAAGLGGWCAPLPLAVTLTRVGGRAMDDDNLGGAFKAIRDRVAGLLLVDDADGRVRWKCKQKPGPTPLVRVALAGR